MPFIRTRDITTRTVCSVDRTRMLAKRMKDSLIRSRKEEKEKREESSNVSEIYVTGGLPTVTRMELMRKRKQTYDLQNPNTNLDASINDTAIVNGESFFDEDKVSKRIKSQERSAETVSERVTHGLAPQNVARSNAVRNAGRKMQSVKERTKAFISNEIQRTCATINDMLTVFASGGLAVVSIITVICLIGSIIGSPYGIFLSKDNQGESITEVVRELSEEYYEGIESIKRSMEYDDLEIVSNDGVYSLRWDEILSVFAVLVSADTSNPMEVVTIDSNKKELLKSLLKEMNSVSSSIDEEAVEETVITEDEEGNEKKETVEKTKTVLTLNLNHISVSEEASRYGFNDQQVSFLNDMLSGEYSTLWATLIGGYTHGMGVIPSEATWVGTGQFCWPLPINGTITSGFGYRTDPFTGETKFHGGIDIAAEAGTPIIAADSGIVTVANGVDPWGGGYGFYVKIDHGNGYETLYGHCFSICVGHGQTVQKNEVIAFVGSTGNSTGNHLHFEIRNDRAKVNPFDLYC